MVLTTTQRSKKRNVQASKSVNRKESARLTSEFSVVSCVQNFEVVINGHCPQIS